MQRSLKSRLEDLEKQGGQTADGMVIFRTFISPGPSGPVSSEPIAVQDSSGWKLDRAPEESWEDFRDRAALLAPRNETGCARLLEVL